MSEPRTLKEALLSPHSKQWEKAVESKFNQLVKAKVFDWIEHLPNNKKAVGVTNFIQSYLHQIFDDSHGLKASLKPLERPFDRFQSRLEAINIGQDIKQINW